MIFQVGDKVIYHKPGGSTHTGKVCRIYGCDDERYPMVVNFGNVIETFTLDGRRFHTGHICLFLDPIIKFNKKLSSLLDSEEC